MNSFPIPRAVKEYNGTIHELPIHKPPEITGKDNEDRPDVEMKSKMKSARQLFEEKYGKDFFSIDRWKQNKREETQDSLI